MKEWDSIIKRYIGLAKLAGIDSIHRKFAVERWIARKNGNPGTLTVEEWYEMLEITGGCYFCGDTENITMEHLMPKSIGGGFTSQNIVPACRRCNQVRGATFHASVPLFLAIEFDRSSSNGYGASLRN